MARVTLTRARSAGEAARRLRPARRITDVLIHFSLEAMGALGLRCVVGLCDHAAHRALAWTGFGLLPSFVTVSVVG